MFQIVPLSLIRSFSMYTQQWYTSYRFAVPSWSCSQAVSKPVWHIQLLCVHWTTPSDGQRNCPKHVEFHSKNKFEKLLQLVGFIRNISFSDKYLERQILTMRTETHASLHVNLSLQLYDLHYYRKGGTIFHKTLQRQISLKSARTDGVTILIGALPECKRASIGGK